MKPAIAIVAIVAGMTSLAAPASAQVQGSFGNAKVTYNAKTEKYCFRETRPSSLVPSIQCRTASEWADLGLTITRKPATQFAQR